MSKDFTITFVTEDGNLNTKQCAIIVDPFGTLNVVLDTSVKTNIVIVQGYSKTVI